METILTTNRRPFTTEARVRREVENAIESILDRWATGDTAAETAVYIEKLRLTAAHLHTDKRRRSNGSSPKTVPAGSSRCNFLLAPEFI